MMTLEDLRRIGDRIAKGKPREEMPRTGRVEVCPYGGHHDLLKLRMAVLVKTKSPPPP